MAFGVVALDMSSFQPPPTKIPKRPPQHERQHKGDQRVLGWSMEENRRYVHCK